MEERDYQNYLDLYSCMSQYLTPPDLVIYLRKSVGRLREQIRLRGRDFEMGIPTDYLSNLNRYYDDWMDSYSLGKKVIVESDELDFVHSPKDFEFIVSQVIENLDQRDFFLGRPGLRSSGSSVQATDVG